MSLLFYHQDENDILEALVVSIRSATIHVECACVVAWCVVILDIYSRGVKREERFFSLSSLLTVCGLWCNVGRLCWYCCRCGFGQYFQWSWSSSSRQGHLGPSEYIVACGDTMGGIGYAAEAETWNGPNWGRLSPPSLSSKPCHCNWYFHVTSGLGLCITASTDIHRHQRSHYHPHRLVWERIIGIPYGSARSPIRRPHD